MKRSSLVWSYIPFVIASSLFIILTLPSLINPFFPGDSGYRINSARSLIVVIGHRIWLPFLQLHIYLLHFLRAPLFAFKLIPITYFLLFLFLLNKLRIKFTRQKWSDTAFGLLFLLSWISNSLILFLALNLYQEIITLFLFHLLLFLYYKNRGKINTFFSFVTFFGLITREYFWIYYFVFILFSIMKNRWKTFPSSFKALAAIPFVWILWTKQALHLGINASLSFDLPRIIKSSIDLLQIFQSTSFLFLIASVCGACVICFLQRGQMVKKDYYVFKEYVVYIVTSLLITYGYIVVFDPWSATPYNDRIAFPLVIFLPFLIIICYKMSCLLRGYWKYMVLLLLVVGLISISNRVSSFPKLLYNNFHQQSFYSQIESAISTVRKSRSPNKHVTAGVKNVDYWNTYIMFLVGPLLYVDRVYYSKDQLQIPETDILIVPAGQSVSSYEVYKEIVLLNGERLRILLKKWFGRGGRT